MKTKYTRNSSANDKNKSDQSSTIDKKLNESENNSKPNLNSNTNINQFKENSKIASEKDKLAHSFDSEKENSLNISRKSLKEKVNNRYDDKEDMSYIRLNKSCEPIQEVRQHMDQFDIEYMCRCLGLALMKHIESSKENFHILEIININDKFDFFNSIYNINIDFFNTFLNLEAKMSNLEKIELIEYSDKKRDLTSGANFKTDDEFPKKISQSDFDKVIKKEELRSGTFGHINYVQSEKNKDNLNNVFKIPEKEDFNMFDKEKQSSELIKELNSINDYFKNGTPLGVEQDTKSKTMFKMRGQELSLIKEEDSHEFCSSNMLKTVEDNRGDKTDRNDKNSADYINLLQNSVVGFLGVKDENNQENEVIIFIVNKTYRNI